MASEKPIFAKTFFPHLFYFDSESSVDSLKLFRPYLPHYPLPEVDFINIFTRGFFEAFLCTANCHLQMATSTTSTTKCNLRMAQLAQFS